MNPTTDTDLLIIGAGPVGLTLARALAGSPWRITVLDRQPASAGSDDPRALALSHGARQLLEALGAWNATAATAIETIHVSQRGGFGRTLLQAGDYRLPALGYVMRYGALKQALQQSFAANPLARVLHEVEVTHIERTASQVQVNYQQDGRSQTLSARLLVHAEGTPYDDPAIDVRDYQQHAVLAEVGFSSSDMAHRQQAWERFTPDGPLALLPLEDKYAIVFTVPPQRADALLQLDDNTFLAALQAQFGEHLRFTSASPRARFPLALRVRPTLVGQREVWIGNTAQTLHPVSGQGFNLGLRDAVELAQTLRTAADPGDAARLAAYARRRQADRRGSMIFTDGIVRLFSNDLPPLRLVRGLGLAALDLFPPARHFVAKRMIWGARAWP